MPEPTAPPQRRPPPVSLGTAHRRWIHSVFVVLWLSGLAWLLFHYFIQVEGTFGPRPHPLEHWWLRLHGLAAMLSLIALGSVLPQHVRGAWELARNRKPGASLTVVTAWLGLSGYALYYFASEANQAWLPLAHWIPGLILPLLLWEHIRRGRARVCRARHQTIAGTYKGNRDGNGPARRPPPAHTETVTPSARSC